MAKEDADVRLVDLPDEINLSDRPWTRTKDRPAEL
jgi:hypothetical protein